MAKRRTIRARGTGTAQKARAAFRHSVEWTDWRMQVIAKAGSRCSCCGMYYPSPRLQCHHILQDKSQYEILGDFDNFACLCSVCHKSIHAFAKKVLSRKRAFEGSEELKQLVMRYIK